MTQRKCTRPPAGSAVAMRRAAFLILEATGDFDDGMVGAATAKLADAMGIIRAVTSGERLPGLHVPTDAGFFVVPACPEDRRPPLEVLDAINAGRPHAEQ